MMNAHEILKRIATEAKAEKGWEIWMVGGPVRDMMMGRDNHDIDCVVEGAESGKAIAEWLKDKADRVGVHGERFGVVKARFNGFEFDFVPPRRENKVAFGKAGFEVDFDNVSMEEDMRRRDFEFNAAAQRVRDGFVFDPFNAAEAIRERRVSPVSEAFCEDHNRVRRGARFAARFDFKADARMVEMAQKVRKDWEREKDHRFQEGWQSIAWAEFQKWAEDVNERPGAFWEFMRDVKFMNFFPEVAAADFDRVVEECNKVRWEVSMDDFEGDAGDKRRERERRAVEMFAAMKRAGVDVKDWMKRMGRSKGFVRKVMNFDEPEPMVEGRDVMTMFPGRKPGPWVGEVQRAAFAAQKAGEFNSPEEGQAWVAANWK